jgi:hypothetical protein
MWALGEVLEFERGQMLWAPNEEDEWLVLDEINRTGNFGHMDENRKDLSKRWTSFWYVNSKTFRFWRFDHWAWFWSPMWRVYRFGCRKLHEYINYKKIKVKIIIELYGY